ncbi:MAG: ATP-binding protein [Pseudomonadota bacterium]
MSMLPTDIPKLHSIKNNASTKQSSFRVLLVEDNPAEADLVMERLSDAAPAEFSVAHAFSVEDADALFADQRFDCIVLDLQLPDTRGPDTIRAMRALRPETTIICYSGMDDEFSRIASLKEGAQDFISKNGPEAGSLGRGILLALERRRAIKLHDQLEDLFAANPDAMIVCGEDRIVRFVNAAACTLFGREQEQLVGAPIEFDLDASNLRNEVCFERNGVTRIGEVRLASCLWDSEPCLLATIRDLTEQKRLAEQLGKLERLQGIGRFAGGIAHDFGNVLSCIELMARSISKEAETDARMQRQMEEIGIAAESGRSLVRQLLSLEQSQVGAPELVDMSRALEKSGAFLARMLPETIEFSVELLDEGLVAFIDPAQIEQVLLNLAFNARDAMSAGGALRISCRRTEERGKDWIELSVSDTGYGIDPEHLPHIFDLFFSTKMKNRGSGLGLGICQAIVEQAGGTIAVRSTIAIGTTFVVRLPIAPRDDYAGSGALKPAALQTRTI